MPSDMYLELSKGNFPHESIPRLKLWLGKEKSTYIAGKVVLGLRKIQSMFFLKSADVPWYNK